MDFVCEFVSLALPKAGPHRLSDVSLPGLAKRMKTKPTRVYRVGWKQSFGFPTHTPAPVDNNP